jgi:hypothetical protein
MEGRLFWSEPNRAPDLAVPGFPFVSGDIGSVVGRAKEAAGSKYVEILGATAAKQVSEAGELDNDF